MNTMHHVALLALAVAGSSDSQVYDVRNTTKGEVQGLLNETSSCRSWRGVFFAADAGGSNRWLAPQPRASWAPHVADATAFGAGCLQIHHNPDVPTNQSEDCLNLNVFSPDYCVGGDIAACALPVLIWYHGGTFTEGWSEGPFDLYDGCNLAHGGDVIVVTANYRLGAMGFLVTKGEGGEGGEYALRGNQGMRDQKAAMEWVRDNIANFGGDPGRVTIFGQSAGSMSVGLHHTSPEMYESGLFKRVIMESNYAGSNIHTLDEASVLGSRFCEALGCWHPSSRACDTACMAAQPAAALTAAWNEASGAVYPWAYDNALTGWHLADGAMSFAPVVDGDFIQCKITECLDSGTFNPAIDVLFGTNSGDGATFVYAVPEALTYTEYELAVAAIWAKPQGTPQAIVDFYASAFPPATTPDGRLPLAQAVNDYLFRCSSEVYGRAVASSGGRAFAYVFDHVYSNAWLFTEFGLAAVCESVACHCEEIPFVFNNTVPSLNATFTPDEVVLATQMVAWWTNFARDGDPNGAGGEPADSTLLKSQAPVWPAFDGDLRQAMHITAPASFVESGGVETCAGFWDGLGYLY